MTNGKQRGRVPLWKFWHPATGPVGGLIIGLAIAGVLMVTLGDAIDRKFESALTACRMSR